MVCDGFGVTFRAYLLADFSGGLDTKFWSAIGEGVTTGEGLSTQDSKVEQFIAVPGESGGK